MPLSGRDAVVLCVLVFCVPLQHWLTQVSVFSQSEKNMEIFKIVNEAKIFYDTHISLQSWKEYFANLSKKLIDRTKDYSHWYVTNLNDPEGVCPAVEVLNLKNPEGTFGMSPKPRSVRPLGLKWRVGQVVKHNRWGYHGIIIGWDPRCKAPEEWIKQMHRNNEGWRNQPNYAVLVDTHDREEPQITYVPQENIHPVKKTEVKHPDLHEYFASFDGAQYLPHKWLRAIYPLD